MGTPGAWSEEKPANQEIQDLVDLLKSDIIRRYGIHVKTFKPVSYKSQVANGMNYEAKVDMGDKTCILSIHKPLTGEKATLKKLQCEA